MRTPFFSPNGRIYSEPTPMDVPGGAAENLKGAMLMVLCMAAFTYNDSLMKAVTAELPLYESIAIRGALVLFFMTVVAALRRRSIRLTVPRVDLGPVVLRGAADIISTLLYLLALRQMALADLSAIMQALPLAVTLAGALVFHESLGWRRLSAIGAGFCGVLMILRPGSSAFDLWSLVALAAMGLIVVRDIATRLFSSHVDSSTIAFHAAGLVMLSGLVMGLSEDWRMPDGREFLLLAGAAALLTVGYFTAVATMRVGEIAFVAPFRYTSLIWAITLGLLFFGEWPDGWTWAGSALVVGAGLYTILRERQLRRRV